MLPELGFHASHEQFAPSELLGCVRRAQAAGFAHGMCSDHFAPFSLAQGQSGFAWAWLGAALASTELTLGTVTAPGQRYHPAIVAQAAATLTEMFPGRLWLALASGENLNEHITGDVWPEKSVRRARVEECVEIMRALFAGQTVSRDGLIRVDRAKLYTRPAQAPQLLGAAVSPESAAWVASWADGLITVNQTDPILRSVVEAFRAHGGAGKPMYLQVHVAYSERREEAVRAACEQWRVAPLGAPLLWDAAMPEELDAAARSVRVEDVLASVRVATRIDELLEGFESDARLGFERVYVHEVGKNQQRILDALSQYSSTR
jgi:probable non-F420 flavinoid oxidoreductase